MPDSRRALPSVDLLLRHRAAAQLIHSHGREPVLAVLREVLQRHRDGQGDAPADDELLAECAVELAGRARPRLRAVLNLSGTVLHTNLGRACLAEPAVRAAVAAMAGATNLEFDLETGRRGERDAIVETLLCALTGAEAATVVNNNAAAVLLALNTVAARREVVVSRGELVEIGGAFRVPDVMSRAGSRLREVGTTNRTHLRDYEAAIGARTAALMKVHKSNFVIQGFACEASQAELAQLARAHALPLLVDLGSGALLDLRQYGLPEEPTARAAIADGADLVTFSGDKLLGGPQCGIVVGSGALIGRLRGNPLRRALRVDKITLAALEATLRLYGDPQRAVREIPTLRVLTRPQQEIRAQAQRLQPAVQTAVGEGVEVAVVDCQSQIGSGARPLDLLSSAGLRLRPLGRAVSAAHIASQFRALPLPVVGRVQHGAFLMDLRCLDDEAEFTAQLPRLRPASATP